jgi:hypothetical protein
MRTLRWLLPLVVLVGSAVTARSNPPPPPYLPMNNGPYPVEMIAVDDERESSLQVGEDLLARLWAQADGPGVEGPRAHLVVAGLALTAAVVLGGLWLVRSRRRPGFGVAAALAGVVLLGTAVGCGLFGTGGGGSTKYPTYPPDVVLSEKAAVVIVPKSNAIRFVANSSQLDAALDGKARPELRPREGKPTTKIVISTDDAVQEVRLQFGRDLLTQLKEQAPGQGKPRSEARPLLLNAAWADIPRPPVAGPSLPTLSQAAPADVLNHGEGNMIRLIVPRAKLREVLRQPIAP